MRGLSLPDLFPISVAFFFAFLGTGAAQPFVIDYLADAKGLTPARASIVLATVYFALGFFRFFIGFIIGFVKLHPAKILGVAAYALFPLVVRYADNFPALIAGSVMWGLGAAMLWTSSLVQVMNTSAPTRYATAAGIVRGTVMIAVFIGMYVLSVTYVHHGYDALFLLSAGFGFLGVLAMLFSPNRRFAHEKPDLRKFLEVMKDREAKLVTIFLVCGGLAYGIVLNGIKAHIELKCGSHWLQFILPVFFITGILSCFFGGYLSDKLGRWPVFQWGFVAGAAGMILAAVSAGPVLLMVAMLLVGVQFAVVPLSGFGWVGDKTTPADRAAVMGYVYFFRDLGVAVAIFIGGVISSPPLGFVIFGVLSIACAVAALVCAPPQSTELTT